MNREQFWKIIDQAVASTSDVFQVPEAVGSQLSQYEPDEIVSFKQHIHQLLVETYRWDLWAIRIHR